MTELLYQLGPFLNQRKLGSKKQRRSFLQVRLSFDLKMLSCLVETLLSRLDEFESQEFPKVAEIVDAKNETHSLL